jgi:glyoxylase-like metal-dependent hydrolase (beta-lactamase superfamily II)/8-oxo-dGTP pyrophosphatase MutT (NUDIX family)
MSAAYRVPADARPAASLILLRDGEAGLEVLMLRRAERDNDLRSGVCVFPGGVVDERDRAAHGHCLGGDDAALSRRFGVAEGALDFAVAALRECFEEAGLLLADRPFDPNAAEPWRSRLQAGEAGAAEVCETFGLRLDLRGVYYHSHWLTPPGAPKRFDTRFFIARAPAGQEAVADYGEAVELMWLTPQQALSRERGLKLLPVTRRTLQDLARFASTDPALEEARSRREIRLTMPRAASSRQGERRVVLPDELPYAEIGRLDPAGRGDVCCEIVAGRAVRLSPRVHRVTAPNPGMMTGPGTNSYLVGGDGQFTVIDPGPADPVHLQALLDAAAGLAGRIERILVTHTHVDHSPGAVALAQATGAPVFGRRATFAAGQDASFSPQREPADGERFDVGAGATLRVIHTPGHASNHLCYLLEQEATLFTGDHVMQGSTVVINPPDGDMAAYLRSLQALLDEPMDWLAPGHGFLVAEPHAVLRALIQHRLRREGRVVDALRHQRQAGLDSLLPEVYADVPAGLHAVARRSLLAHLLKLEADGVAAADGDVWRYVEVAPG